VSSVRCSVLALIGTAILAAETIHLKTRELDPRPDRTAYQASPLKRRTPGTSHYMVQFERQVNAETFRQLQERGIAVTGYLPRTALMVAAPDDFSLDGMAVRWVGRLEWHDKISPLVLARAAARGLRVYAVEFHSDVDMREARALVKEHNLHLMENSDAGAHRLLVGGPFGSLSRLASWDEVAYIFPASPELIAHVPVRVRGCGGSTDDSRRVFRPGLSVAGDQWAHPRVCRLSTHGKNPAGGRSIGNVARVQRVGEGSQRELHPGNQRTGNPDHEHLVCQGRARRCLSIRRAGRRSCSYLLSRSAQPGARRGGHAS